MHYVNCIDSEVCLVVSPSKTVLSWLLFVLCVSKLLFLLPSYCTTPALYVKMLKQPVMGGA